ncbi:autoinducer-binding domain-containing protein [Hyphomicrobium denitrificans 1NES1]|uniref:Autoinducer-binding domain-containing protein n=1 Tax=Hyphomicrobium denitrificans 1NES1 TaxID=670307 RepID=N0BH31_9HYPH|nr:LuxR family transcriptional regulator [Hyphomicrobium denitrificans]AGK59751.1 autoinducer-binding domain-containing protein [Hyphomicrobium denitrificans 1NES1]
MHRVFQTFVERLVDSVDAPALCAAMAEAAIALDVPTFAYLTAPRRPDAEPGLISSYPPEWTSHYLQSRYDWIDPVVSYARNHLEPFEWGPDVGPIRLSKQQQQFFDEASEFGIRYGFTIPIHNGRGTVAVVSFATELRQPAFCRSVAEHARVLQLMAMYFHAQARRKLNGDRIVDGVLLSPREFECLEWAARGKSAWEMARILGVSRRTAAFHLDNAKSKLSVRTICQAVAKLAASKPATR